MDTISGDTGWFMRKIRDGLQVYLAFSSALFISLIIVRAAECFQLYHVSKLSGIDFQVLISGLRFDAFIFFQIVGILFVPFLLLHLISRKVAIIFYYILAFLIIISYLGLVSYFVQASLPLGADLLSYSWADINQTVQASGGADIISILFFIISPLVFFILVRGASLVRFPILVIIPVLLLSVFTFYFPGFGKPNSSEKLSEEVYNLKLSKLQFFTEKVYSFLTADENYAVEGFYIDTEVDYLSSDYAFLRKRGNEDVLSPFFNFSAKQPSIVFIVVEGLGRAFSGPNAYLGSFTPFLDSLAGKSLYWSNCMSASGRTFGVLPSLLGSLPYGKTGFMELADKMPKAETLISLLKRKGYSTTFFYGSDARFDGMKTFLTKQAIGRIIEEKDFGPSYVKLPNKNDGFSWGFGDKELYRKSLEDKETDTPKLDIFLTVTSHNPYLVPQQEKYRKLVKQQLSKSKRLNALNSDLPYLDMYASIRYVDESLAYFFEEYSKRSDFASTIFIITGDHRLPEIPLASKTDRYHVPLLIYSPLLKDSKLFPAVTSHLDVLPSIASYLNKSYALPVPSSVSWIGSSLDTSSQFRSKKSFPLMPNKNELIDYLDGNYFISGDQLFVLNKDLYAEPIEDKKKYDELKDMLTAFKARNQRMIESGILLPDSLLR